MKKILSIEKGKIETMHYAEHDDTAAIQTQVDVTGILRANQFERSNQQMGHKSEVFNKVANIPYVAVTAWCKAQGLKYEEFFQDNKHLKRFLNDSDNKAWRTRTGKI
jgi:hypothetical protein